MGDAPCANCVRAKIVRFVTEGSALASCQLDSNTITYNSNSICPVLFISTCFWNHFKSLFTLQLQHTLAPFKTIFWINRHQGGQTRQNFIWTTCFKLFNLFYFVRCFCILDDFLFVGQPSICFNFHSHCMRRNKTTKLKNRGLNSRFRHNFLWQMLFKFIFAF